MKRPVRFKTDGERWLAQYFEEVRGWAEGLVWQYEPEFPGKRRRPDFRVAADNGSCMLEVKDFGDAIEELPTTLRVLRPYRRIRCKFDAGRKQLEEFSYEMPCALVLRPGPTADTDVTSPARIMEALIGPADRPSSRFAERYSVLGAVVTLRWRRVRVEAFDVAWSMLREARGGQSPSRGMPSRHGAVCRPPARAPPRSSCPAPPWPPSARMCAPDRRTPAEFAGTTTCERSIRVALCRMM